MNILKNLKPGIVAEWMSLIDPKSANSKNYDEKLAATLETQAALLLNSNMTEIRAKNWILTKKVAGNEVIIEFSLVAYRCATVIPLYTEEELHKQKMDRMKEQMLKALEREDYILAAQVRDNLRDMMKKGSAFA